MKTIWKFLLLPKVTMHMPIGAKVLAVQAQDGDINLWAELDPDQPKEARSFSVYGTGHALPEDPGKYLGTVQLQQGLYIFHVYEDAP